MCDMQFGESLRTVAGAKGQALKTGLLHDKAGWYGTMLIRIFLQYGKSMQHYI